MTKLPAVSGGGPLHLVLCEDGIAKEQNAQQLETGEIPIILKPLFTKFWPQDPNNMIVCPYNNHIPASDTASSWRRIQLTSPSVLELEMTIWYAKSSGKGNQMSPATGRIETGATLGHVVDLLDSLPKNLEQHWMSINGHAWWTRSVDAVVEPKLGEGGVDNPSICGVYVNPSNGLSFPGAF